MFKLKLSQSLINMWLAGRKSEVIESLFGKWREPNQYQKFGIEQHEKWEQEVNETHCLPAVFGGEKLHNPQTEVYRKIQLADWLWYSGITDLIDNEILYDYKTGKTRANAYVKNIQVGSYGLLFPEAKAFKYLCWNQYNDTITMATILITEELKTETIDKILTVACDIRAEMERLGYTNFNNVDKPLKESEIKK